MFKMESSSEALNPAGLDLDHATLEGGRQGHDDDRGMVCSLPRRNDLLITDLSGEKSGKSKKHNCFITKKTKKSFLKHTACCSWWCNLILIDYSLLFPPTLSLSTSLRKGGCPAILVSPSKAISRASSTLDTKCSFSLSWMEEDDAKLGVGAHQKKA